MKRGNHGFAEELLFRENIKGGIAPRRSPLYNPPWARGDPRDPQNDVIIKWDAIKNAIVF